MSRKKADRKSKYKPKFKDSYPLEVRIRGKTAKAKFDSSRNEDCKG